ncbi:hypothetical protein VHEMI03333 [[Torrubiella] hemipterigena]|uniref:Uncharacterized protein n=1 Tax=[Torrubiella] hemipterigena TaxID=1531966 RepID=A0A0A1TAI9_9HYPO|nr:hypothetical protein VHEMI03333 [[Torrubiella] hemipterigena]
MASSRPNHGRPTSHTYGISHQSNSPKHDRSPSGMANSSSFLSFGGADGAMEPTRALLAMSSRRSRTWSSSSADLGILEDADVIEDRSIFIHEYNTLAKAVGDLFDEGF